MPTGTQPPLMNAGLDLTIGAGKVVSLKALQVSTGITYLWSQISGPTVIIESPHAAQTLFISPRSSITTQTLEFSLLGTDVNGLQSLDSVQFTIVQSTNILFAADVLELEPLSQGRQLLGITYDAGSNAQLISAKQFQAISDSQIAEMQNSPDLFSDLIEFSIKTIGATSASVRVHLAETVPDGHVWWKFSRIRNQWLVFPTDMAVFSQDRKSIQLTIIDNSEFDDDFREGEIKDPSGPGAPDDSIATAKSGGGGGGGCFIATAAFGTYDHSSVIILRDFRDNFLLENSYGKWFVKQYYSYSPLIADCIAKNRISRFLVQLLLLPLLVFAIALTDPKSALLLLIFMGAILTMVIMRFSRYIFSFDPMKK